MAREKSFFEEVAEVPWWVGVTMAVGAAVIIETTLHRLTSANAILAELGKPLLLLRIGIPAGLLMAAAASDYRDWRRGELFRSQRSLSDVHRLTWQQFESLAYEILKRDGYTVTARGGAGPDGGVDLIARKDGSTNLVQCKHWKTRKIGVKPVRELFGVMAAEKAAGGIFVTSGSYTDEAIRFGEANQMQMIGGLRLVRYLNESRTGDPEPQLEQVEPERLVETNVCPDCGGEMARRVARKGRSAGSEFWGCKRYPGCKGTRNL